MKSSADKFSSSNSSKSRSVLNAVALQDHLVKSLSLQDPFKTKVNHKPKINANHQKKTGTQKSNKNLDDNHEEYVLDAKPKQLTLAQKRGLVDAPPARLSDKEWQDVKNKSNQRNDSDQPCVICKEEFGTQHQVLLSCSHVFHRVCLQAFEKFSGGKTCPMCRKEQYETRVIHEGRKLWKHKCAIKIQAAWRGYIVRCWYLKLRETVPPNEPKLRRKFYEEKLRSITDRFVMSMSNNEVDALLTQIDQSVEESRRIMSFVEENRFKTMSTLDWQNVYEQMNIVCQTKDFTHRTKGSVCQTNIICHGVQANERLWSDCPICFTSLSSGVVTQRQSLCGRGSAENIRPVVLLSCSHVFHKKCVEAFEQLSLNTSHVCPVCRSVYYKKDLHLH